MSVLAGAVKPITCVSVFAIDLVADNVATVVVVEMGPVGPVAPVGPPEGPVDPVGPVTVDAGPVDPVGPVTVGPVGPDVVAVLAACRLRRASDRCLLSP